MKLQQFLLDELENSKDNPGLTLYGVKYDNDLYVSMKAFWDQFTGEITHETACTSCKMTIESQEPINYLLLKFSDDYDKKCDEDCTVESLIKYHLQEQCIEDRWCSCCKEGTSGIRKSAITKFPSFMCILLCRNLGDDKITISSAVQFPALGFDIKGDDMPYDLSATVHYKQTKDGNGHYMAISRSRALQSQQWFMYDDDRVSLSNFTNRITMVKKSYTKTATILFYVSPSIDACIKKAQTIDLMEGGKEQAQNVPNSEINCCDEDGKEGHIDGSSRDVPIQTDSEGAKKR